MRESEEIEDPQCPENTNKTECVYLKNNYNSIDFTEVEQIDENIEYLYNGTENEYRPPIGPILLEVILENPFKKYIRVL